MKAQRLAILGVFFIVIAAAMTLKALDGHQAAPMATHTPAPRPPRARVADYRGFAITLHGSSHQHPYEKAIDELENTGSNSILFVPIGWQENAGSSSIFIDVRKSPPPERIAQIVRYSRSRGLAPMLMPIILLDSPRAGEWRGKIKPDNADAWWDNYNRYILHYAGIAQDAGAEVLIIGSELVLMENQTDRWRTLISEVRKVFKGRLSYSANWDHYQPVQFWDDLDMIGMTTYYDLAGAGTPTLETITNAWKPIKDNILKWQATINKPILFTEVGWPNQVTCAKYPWDYTRSPKEPDTGLQAACFKAFFDTWHDEPAVAGTIVWEWKYDPAQRPENPQDRDYTGYIPKGKPAMDVILQYFRRPSDLAADGSK